MSNTMIYQGSSAGALIKGEVKITTGLAFIKDVIIDSHFDKRGRFGRSAQAVASNPSCIGIGLGEDTGVLIKNNNHLEAIGSGLVIICRWARHQTFQHCGSYRGFSISIENLVVNVMTKGNAYELKKKDDS